MPSAIPLDDSLGALLIGVIVSTAIYGITCLQVYMYYTDYCGRDGRFLKSFVALIMVIDTLHIALLGNFLYHYMVTNFGDYEVLAKLTWSIDGEIAVGALLELLVQYFYAYRIWCISKRRLAIPTFICVLALAQLALGIAYVVKCLQAKFFANDAVGIPYLVSGRAIDIAVDVSIVVSMIYYLRKSSGLLPRTSKAISLIINYALNTCLLTIACNIVTLVLWVVPPVNGLLSAPFYFVCVRLYSCSFMSILNSRETVRAELHGENQGVFTLANFNSTIPPTDRADNGGSGRSDTFSDMPTGVTIDHKGIKIVDPATMI